MAFARLVTHYWLNAAWIEDGSLLRDAGRLATIPAVLIHGRSDLSSPIDIPWQLAQSWPGSELVIVDEAGHGTGEPAIASAVVAATDRFARTERAKPSSVTGR
jgi:proline iminopeptidase